MKLFNKVLFFAVILGVSSTYAQPSPGPKGLYGIKDPSKNISKRCFSFFDAIDAMPSEIDYGLQADDEGNVYFVFGDIEYFEKIFVDELDGIAIDVISKRLYPCRGENKTSSEFAYKGELLPPVYKKDLLKNNVSEHPKELKTLVGKIPEKILSAEFEINLLILKNNYMCGNYNLYELPSSEYELFPLHLVMDTLEATTDIEKSILLNKGFEFIIPFEKGVYNYDHDKIQPIYDSLHLSDFYIKKIEIRAYASVEGSVAKNLELQNKRAESILAAMQTFQNENIKTEVKTAENWVEFYEDIKNTKYKESLSNLSEEEIKKELEKPEVKKDLEEILQHHRKAVLILDLEKKSKVLTESPEEIKKIYYKAVTDHNIGELLEIQHSVFSLIEQEKLDKSFLFELDSLPENSQYATAINNHLVKKFYLNLLSHRQSMLEFNRLSALVPENLNLLYNSSVLSMQLWFESNSSADPSYLEANINKLEDSHITDIVMQRLKLNYHIIKTIYHDYHKDYDVKGISLDYIYDEIDSLDLTNSELLDLAKFFASHYEFEKSLAIIKPKVTTIDVEEDLLF